MIRYETYNIRTPRYKIGSLKPTDNHVSDIPYYRITGFVDELGLTL